MVRSQSSVNRPKPTQTEYYCEFVCSAGRWVHVSSNVQSGYTCPSFVSGCDSEGAVRREPPVPLMDHKTRFPGESTCTYEYRNGRWELVDACVSPCCPCPVSLEDYSKRHPKLVIAVAHLVMVCPPPDECPPDRPHPGHDKAKGATVQGSKKSAKSSASGQKKKAPRKKKR